MQTAAEAASLPAFQQGNILAGMLYSFTAVQDAYFHLSTPNNNVRWDSGR